MPILLPVTQLQPGMTLAANVTSDNAILLAYRRQITQDDIDSLRDKFPHLLLQILHPILDQNVEFQDDSRDADTAHQVRASVANAAQKVNATLRSGTALTAQTLAPIQDTIHQMLQYLQDNPVNAALLEQTATCDDYLQQHAANVFYLSMLIGNTLRNYVKQERERLSSAKSLSNALNLNPLALAALLHDVGMVPLEKLYRKNAPLDPDQIAAVRQHPLKGAALLPQKVDAMVRLVIRSHHENYCGTGYPRKLAGDRITIFARIIRVADAYAAAIARKQYKNAKSPARALHEMTKGPYQTLYDPNILNVFARLIQPFPIGAKLKLNSGQTAVVTKHDPRHPFAPHVIIAFDQHDKPLTQDQLQPPFALCDQKQLWPTQFAGEDLTFLRESPNDPPPPSPPQPDQPTELLTLLYP